MVPKSYYRPHRVVRQTRDDGAVLLRSGYDMTRPALTTGCWLHRWADRSPDAVFLAERSGPGWRVLTYGAALDEVRALAAALLDRGLGPTTPILTLSGNGVDHGLLSLAAQYVGIPTLPLAEHYSQIPAAQQHLRRALEMIDPPLVFANDGTTFAQALNLDEMAGREIVTAHNAGPRMLHMDELRRSGTADVTLARAAVGPDSVVKILLTAGSDGAPKGVPTTHRMMCANQAQIADALPFLRDRPPRVLDGLRWHHVAGGSMMFNMMLANGGALYIDQGQPTPAGFAQSLENHRLIGGTLAVNSPQGWAMLRDELRRDAALRTGVLSDLDMILCIGGAMPDDVFDDLTQMAAEARGVPPLVCGAWGMTETAPVCTLHHQRSDKAGAVGVPLTGVELKLVPLADAPDRYDVRVKGPNVMAGYAQAPGATKAAFDTEGYLRTGDAMTFVDPDNPARGLRFDGRLSEDFKLRDGAEVPCSQLRLDLLVHLAGIARDVILTGPGQPDVGLLVVPVPSVTGTDHTGVLDAPTVAEELAWRLVKWNNRQSRPAKRVARALLLSEMPSAATGELSAKGSVIPRILQDRRTALIDRLYSEDGPGIIRLP